MRFADKARIPDVVLRRAVLDAERGLIAADLGGLRDQATHRETRPGEVWRISNADCIQRRRTGDDGQRRCVRSFGRGVV